MFTFITIIGLLVLIASPFLGIFLGTKINMYGNDMALLCMLTTTVGTFISIFLVVMAL